MRGGSAAAALPIAVWALIAGHWHAPAQAQSRSSAPMPWAEVHWPAQDDWCGGHCALYGFWGRNTSTSMTSPEITFALPQDPPWELVARLHHRSGMRILLGDVALFNGVDGGAHFMTLGVRWRF